MSDDPPPRRVRRPDSGPQRVAESMAKVLGRIGASPSATTMELVFTRWEEVVGPEFAAHLQPVRVQDATLVIGADHAAWATRARMDAARILAQVRALGDTSIARIEVVIRRP